MYMYQVTVQFSSLTSCSCLIKEWCFFILRIVGGRRWIHLFCKVVGWSVWCHPAKKQNRKKINVMEEPYITQDVTGIIFRIKYYGPHTKNINTINR